MGRNSGGCKSLLDPHLFADPTASDVVSPDFGVFLTKLHYFDGRVVEQKHLQPPKPERPGGFEADWAVYCRFQCFGGAKRGMSEWEEGRVVSVDSSPASVSTDSEALQQLRRLSERSVRSAAAGAGHAGFGAVSGAASRRWDEGVEFGAVDAVALQTGSEESMDVTQLTTALITSPKFPSTDL